MAFQFSVSLYYCVGKRWQGYGFSSFDHVFFWICCACTFLQDWVAQHTVFHGVVNLVWSKVPNESTVISASEVPMVTGTLFQYSVMGRTSRRASVVNTWVPVGKDNSASIKPTYSIASPLAPSILTNWLMGCMRDTHEAWQQSRLICVTWLPVSSKAVTVFPFTIIFSSLALPINLVQGSGFGVFEFDSFSCHIFTTYICCFR